MSSLLLSLLLLPVLLLTLASTLEFRYHSNREIEQYLHQINASNPDITHLYSIGQSVRGNDQLLVCDICRFQNNGSSLHLKKETKNTWKLWQFETKEDEEDRVLLQLVESMRDQVHVIIKAKVGQTKYGDILQFKYKKLFVE